MLVKREKYDTLPIFLSAFVLEQLKTVNVHIFL